MKQNKRAADKQRPPKSWALLLLTVLLAGFFVGLFFIPWVLLHDLEDFHLALLANASAVGWLVVHFWALYHLVFRVAALFKSVPSLPPRDYSGDVHFVLLYLTCDDFQESACLSCLNQVYPRDAYRVLICDDSRQIDYRERIDRFIGQYTMACVVRRHDNKGYKAGNVNHAMATQLRGGEEWVILADADQSLPDTFLACMASIVSRQPLKVAFVQAGFVSDHDHRSNENSKGCTRASAFQTAMGLEVVLFYSRDLVWREACGFMPSMGHGVAIRRYSWEALGGIPEIVSEDFGFAFGASLEGMYGVYAGHLHARESYPKDYPAFLIRLCKFAGGAAEFFRLHLRHIISSKARCVERIDLLLLLLWYPLMLVIVVNGFLSAYVCHKLWERDLASLHPVLPYLFLGMYLVTLLVLFSATENAYAAFRYWFWAVAVYGAAMPFSAWRFCKHLFVQPTYQRTPKGEDPSPPLPGAGAFSVLLGVSALTLSWLWWSPFSPMLSAQGAAYICVPLYKHLGEPTALGALSRTAVWIPGTQLLVGLYTMWYATIYLT